MTRPGAGSRIRRMVALLAVPALLAPAACSSSGSDDAAITWYHIQTDDPMLSEWQAMADEFVAANDGTEIDVNTLANEDFKTFMTTEAQGGSVPDLFQTWGGGVLEQQVEAGLVKDITDDVADWIDVIDPAHLTPYTIDGRLYGVPFDTGMVGIWYNKDLFADAGITETPTTWTEFLDAVQALKNADITPIALAGGEQWPGHYWWTYLVMRVVGLETLQTSAENGSFDDPGFVEAGELVSELVALDPFQNGWAGAPYGDPDGQAEAMGTGEAAMELMGQWAPVTQETAAGESLGDSLGFFPFPEVEGSPGLITDVMGGGNGFAVGANAPDETVDFLEYLLTPENQQREVSVAGVTPVAADPASVMAEENPYITAVLDTLSQQTGFQLYLDQDYPPAIGETINASTAALLLGEMSPQEVVDSINTEWDRLA